jgi:netrin-G3 ligand
MQVEFKRLAAIRTHPVRFVSASLLINKPKNRLVNVLPYESTRVCLQPIRGVEGSDYINSSFIDGYRYRNAYIATQGPLMETTEDFWRMLWEQNSTIVVMLTKLQVNSDAALMLNGRINESISSFVSGNGARQVPSVLAF